MANKKEFVERVAESHGLHKKDVKSAVDVLLSTIESLLSEGEEVTVQNFGRFTTHVNKAYTGRNPQTGEPLEVPEKRVPKFRPSESLKQAVN